MSVLILDNRFIENKHFIIKDTGYKTPCFIWIKAIRKGYSCFTLHFNSQSKLTMSVHKHLYERKFGYITDGKELDHLCNIKECINTDHLEAVTKRVNISRSYQRGRVSYWSKKTHCPKEHEYTDVNTYITKSGSRVCRICRTESKR